MRTLILLLSGVKFWGVAEIVILPETVELAAGLVIVMVGVETPPGDATTATCPVVFVGGRAA